MVRFVWILEHELSRWVGIESRVQGQTHLFTSGKVTHKALESCKSLSGYSPVTQPWGFLQQEAILIHSSDGLKEMC